MTNVADVFKANTGSLSRIADGLAVAVAVSLPWSTSATGILVVIWLLALLPTLDVNALRREVMTPAGGLPVLLVALGAIGMLWADLPWTERLAGFSGFARLLIIPLMLVQFQRSDRGKTVLLGFLISCAVLLACSLLVAVWPRLGGFRPKAFGVPVKDYIVQSGEFVACAFGLSFLAVDLYRAHRRLAATACLLLAGAFMLNVLYIASGRTALVTIPFLLILFALWQFGWKRGTGIIAAAAVLGTLIWFSSPYLQRRVVSVGKEVQAYVVDRKATSAGQRLDYWKKSLGFIATAPVLGHGTGSIRQMFEKASEGETGSWAIPSENPHNQTLVVGVQIGLLGIAVLWAMWISHLLLFRGEGLLAWIGLVVVVQNIIGSLFNSHLFDFTQGWLYILGVGAAGGAVLSARRNQPGRSESMAASAQTAEAGRSRSGARAETPI